MHFEQLSLWHKKHLSDLTIKIGMSATDVWMTADICPMISTKNEGMKNERLLSWRLLLTFHGTDSNSLLDNCS